MESFLYSDVVDGMEIFLYSDVVDGMESFLYNDVVDGMEFYYLLLKTMALMSQNCSLVGELKLEGNHVFLDMVSPGRVSCNTLPVLQDTL